MAKQKQDENVLSGENRELKARVSVLEKDAINQSKELNSARKEAAKTDDLKAQIKELEAQVKAAEVANDRLEASVSSLKANEQKVDQQLSDLEALKRLLRG